MLLELRDGDQRVKVGNDQLPVLIRGADRFKAGQPVVIAFSAAISCVGQCIRLNTRERLWQLNLACHSSRSPTLL